MERIYEIAHELVKVASYNEVHAIISAVDFLTDRFLCDKELERDFTEAYGRIARHEITNLTEK